MTTIINDENKVSINEKKKIKKTLFWGIQIKKDPILNNPLIKDCLQSNLLLIPLNSIHSTVLYVGKIDNPNEIVYENYKFKKCELIITGHGYSDNALALKVDSIKFIDDNTIVPSFVTTQHITVALKNGIKAIDSVKTLQGEGIIVNYDIPIILQGTLMSY